MKATFVKLMSLAFAAIVAAPLAADEGENFVPPQAKVIDETIGELGLNDDQMGKYQKIYEQHLPVLKKQYEQQEQIFTPDQKAKRNDAKLKAKDQGLKGKDYEQFVQQSYQFTPEQQKQYVECETDMIKTQGKFRDEVYQILTPQQQEKFPKFKGKDKVGPKGKGGNDKPQLQVEPKQGQPQKQGKPDKFDNQPR